MFQSDHSPDLPAGTLLAELGIDPAAVREAIEDERAMRCPVRPAVYPEHGFASLYPEPAAGRVRRGGAGPALGPGVVAPPGVTEVEASLEKVSGRGFGRVSRPPVARNPSS